MPHLTALPKCTDGELHIRLIIIRAFDLDIYVPGVTCSDIETVDIKAGRYDFKPRGEHTFQEQHVF